MDCVCCYESFEFVYPTTSSIFFSPTTAELNQPRPSLPENVEDNDSDISSNNISSVSNDVGARQTKKAKTKNLAYPVELDSRNFKEKHNFWEICTTIQITTRLSVRTQMYFFSFLSRKWLYEIDFGQFIQESRAREYF